MDVMREWRPIETAPKDRRILTWNGENYHVASWVKNPFTDDEAFLVASFDDDIDGNNQLLTRPTHWMDLPEEPSEY